ncbi:putative 10TM heavy-metal exporter [Defluviimonas denitrificans]|uniref:Putative 10TM heavy-metal exporter n=1 Tax=Albidovulum denitrificans TaxID=404881 RepID=A0A2S8SEU0_9RHOB|nr:putative manganese transporter [Defluviimonas denitrificans]PQV59310.1 putative 10TM heavy-metal exporter [Defluviimonas denitrificans]
MALTALAPNAVRRPGRMDPRRLALVGLIVALALAPGDLGALTRGLMQDAFVQVSAFVAATLLLFYGLERLFRFDLGQAMGQSRMLQVPFAALLGATPGCGGAVVVVAAYASGKVSFGAVVATLTATMGDAAFLLIATRPDVALVLLPMQFATGILTGWLVDRFLTVDYRPAQGGCEVAPLIGATRPRHYLYLAALIPGLIVGAAQIGGIEVTQVLGIPVAAFALTGIFTGLAIWTVSPVKAMTNPADAPVTRMAEETAFISIWVVIAYLAYDYAAAYGGFDLKAMFQTIAPALPLIAAAIGFIPGCGPQVLVATLFVNGAIPFSALAANAISNDGDALFPAIALAPRAAIMATVFSTVPALTVAYALYLFAPGFLN